MIKDIEGLLAKAYKEIRERADIAVVGLSGGADSTLVATLCSQALGKENVYGVHMPYGEVDLEKFNSNSLKVAKQLGVNSVWVPIKTAVDKLQFEVEAALNTKLSTLNHGNTRSRMRMVSLYAVNCSIAEQTGKRCRVIGTGNASEDVIGYDTLGGDALADLFIIGTLFKSEVYQLLDYFVSKNILTEKNIDRVPSAGLWNNQTDRDELGYSYDEMEPSLVRLLAGKIDENNPIDKFVLQRHIANKHKHEARPVVDLTMFRS